MNIIEKIKKTCSEHKGGCSKCKSIAVCDAVCDRAPRYWEEEKIIDALGLEVMESDFVCSYCKHQKAVHKDVMCVPCGAYHSNFDGISVIVEKEGAE